MLQVGKSGRGDSNPRPLGPEPSALARLRHAPFYTAHRLTDQWNSNNWRANIVIRGSKIKHVSQCDLDTIARYDLQRPSSHLLHWFGSTEFASRNETT